MALTRAQKRIVEGKGKTPASATKSKVLKGRAQNKLQSKVHEDSEENVESGEEDEADDEEDQDDGAESDGSTESYVCSITRSLYPKVHLLTRR